MITETVNVMMNVIVNVTATAVPVDSELESITLTIHTSRHTVVCRAAQEAGAPHREYIDRKKENVIFTLLYLGDGLSD